MKQKFFILFAFLAACSVWAEEQPTAPGEADTVVLPPYNAAARVWEYKLVPRAGDYMEIQKKFNELGGEGWELVGVDTDQNDQTLYYFKRLKPIRQRIIVRPPPLPRAKSEERSAEEAAAPNQNKE